MQSGHSPLDSTCDIIAELKFSEAAFISSMIRSGILSRITSRSYRIAA